MTLADMSPMAFSALTVGTLVVLYAVARAIEEVRRR